MIKSLGLILLAIVLFFVNYKGINGKTLPIKEGKETSSNLYKIVDVNYCELVDNPKLYDKQNIRITTLYRNGFELSEFYDSDCSNKGSIWVEFDSKLKQFTSKDIFKVFDSKLNPKRKQKPGIIGYSNTIEMEITVVGQFNGALPGILIGPPDNQKRILTGHGHPGAFNYLFTIKSIEAIKH